MANKTVQAVQIQTHLDWKFSLQRENEDIFTRRGQIKGPVLEKFNPKGKNYVKSKITQNVLSQTSRKKGIKVTVNSRKHAGTRRLSI